MVANTIIPIANPINLDGHISPSYATTKYSTDFINNHAIGIEGNSVRIGYLASRCHLILPCNCRKVSIWAINPYNVPFKRFEI